MGWELLVDEFAEPVGADVAVAFTGEEVAGDVVGGDVVADGGVESVGHGHEAVGAALAVDQQGSAKQVFTEVVEVHNDDLGAAQPGAGGES